MRTVVIILFFLCVYLVWHITLDYFFCNGCLSEKKDKNNKTKERKH